MPKGQPGCEGMDPLEFEILNRFVFGQTAIKSFRQSHIDFTGENVMPIFG
jgi:hypothetical protein